MMILLTLRFFGAAFIAPQRLTALRLFA